MYGFSRTLNTIMNIQSALERAMEDGFSHTSTFNSGVFPPINILEKDERIHVISELPGVSSKDLNIEVKGRHLRIKGERELKYDDGASIHRMERKGGSFDRTIGLPYEVDSGKAEASFENGLLTIVLPKAESEKTQVIQIN
ncbi:MAG: heat-shock protein Hsp20 [Acidobacteria bacterium]|nr:MAG: heat-shock protein Hsp20 [Acidobacteriota bacterium]